MIQNISKYVLAARKAGCPIDQIRNFVEAGYVATPEQLQFHAAARLCDNPLGPTDLALGGNRGGMKSHSILAQVALDDCQRFPGLKFLFLRKTQVAESESFDDLVRRVLSGVQYQFSNGKIQLKNGSKIIIGGYHNEQDIDSYVGIEYDGLIVEERCQISGEKIEKLYGSIRTSKSKWRPRKYNSTNPGGIGHKDFVDTFIAPWREGNETDTRFFQTSFEDNPFLDEAYKKWLRGLTGKLGLAWKDGCWDAYDGLVWPEWRNVKLTDIDYNYPISGIVLDHGRVHPTAVLFFRYDPYLPALHIYDEYWATGLYPDDHAPLIWAKLNGKRPDIEVADSAIFADIGKSKDKPSIASEYESLGFHFEPSGKNEDAQIVRAAMWMKNGYISVNKKCHHTINECSSWCYNDKGKPIDKANDCCDNLKYLIEAIEKKKGMQISAYCGVARRRFFRFEVKSFILLEVLRL